MPSQPTGRSFFDQPRTHPAQYIFAAALLEDHILDSVLL
jgi:hypothetical protein